MNNQQKFLSKLFEAGERTCYAPDAFETAIWPAPTSQDLFFCINALSGPRADANVASYRNFLLELDNIPLPEQIDLVTKRLPVTSIVFSGGKSYHFIVSLLEPVQTEADYRRVWRGLYEAVPEADKSTKNPSRFSRLPGVLRPDTGLYQELVYLGDRIPLAKLPTPAPYREPKPAANNILFVTQQLNDALAMGVDNYIEGHFSGRNQFFYWLGKRLSELGHSRTQKKEFVEKFYNRLSNKSGFSITEAYAASRVKF